MGLYNSSHAGCILKAWHTTSIPPCLRCTQAWRFKSNCNTPRCMLLLICWGLKGAGSQGRCSSMASAISLGNYSEWDIHESMRLNKKPVDGKILVKVLYLYSCHKSVHPQNSARESFLTTVKLLDTVALTIMKEYVLQSRGCKVSEIKDHQNRFPLCIKEAFPPTSSQKLLD